MAPGVRGVIHVGGFGGVWGWRKGIGTILPRLFTLVCLLNFVCLLDYGVSCLLYLPLVIVQKKLQKKENWRSRARATE